MNIYIYIPTDCVFDDSDVFPVELNISGRVLYPIQSNALMKSI